MKEREEKEFNKASGTKERTEEFNQQKEKGNPFAAKPNEARNIKGNTERQDNRARDIKNREECAEDDETCQERK